MRKIQMMSLVDYGESSSGSDGEETQHLPESSTPSKVGNSTSTNSVASSLPHTAVSSGITSIPLDKDDIEVDKFDDKPSKFQVEEDEVEDGLRMRLPGNLKKSDILKPPPRRRKKGKVTIAAYKLSDDSDSDDSETKKSSSRKPKAKGGHQGLASLLPAPQAMIVREGNKPFIPHSVSRRPNAKQTAGQTVAAKPEVPVEAPSKMKSFFSIDDDDDDIVMPPPPQPLPVDSGHTFGPQPAPSTGPSPMETEPSGACQSSISDGAFIPEDILPESERRHQRKRRHCDAPGIIDIRQDELTAGAEIEFTKTISQEEDEWAKKRHGEAMPSKMAARKHQITWLAYQAKEQEFELKNSWATAKFNKTQTRNKYGF